MKKIAVITGSPRKNGNSFAMTDAFIRAAEGRGFEVKRFDTAFLDIRGCHDCGGCYRTGKPCAFDDDFNTIAPAIEEADAVVFTMPVYWCSMPAQIKALIDKLYSFCVAGRDIKGKQCALIACCEEKDMNVFEGVCIPYARTALLLDWDDIGTVLVPGVFAPGDIDSTDGCARAAALADKLQEI
jgi:multimeric flavodoxin WrbA